VKALAPAVVIGLGNLVGLQTARKLAGNGVPVIGIGDHPGQPFARTRVCEKIVYADTTGPDLIEALEKLGPELGQKAVLYPCDDITVLAVSEARTALASWYHIVLPPHEVLQILMDKVTFQKWAAEQGLPIPESRSVTSRADAELAGSELEFPVVLKPDMRGQRWFDHTSEKAIICASPDTLAETFDRVSAWADAFTIQEWIPGGEESLFSCNAYFGSDGRPLATFVARKVRQWPPRTGRSSLGVEARNDVVLDTTLDLFQKAGMRGLGYLEMKRHAVTGRHLIIEPNVGRPTGRSAISEAGGVKLIYTMYCDALGLPLPAERVQTYGNAKWIYWRWDLQSAFSDWRRGDLSIRDWFESIRGPKIDAVFSWRDPGPFLADISQTIRRRAGDSSERQ